MFALAAAIVVAGRMFIAQEAADILGAMPALYPNRVFALAGVRCLMVLQLSLRRP